MAGSTEDDRRPHGSQGVGEQRGPLGARHRPEDVLGRHDVGGVDRDLVTDRIVLVLANESSDVTVESGGEQHGLATTGGEVEDASDGRHETHIGHAIGLVEHDALDLGEPDPTLSDEVLEAAGAGDEDVDTGLQRLSLRAVADASVHGSDPHAPRQRRQFLADLVSELAGGCEHESLRVMGTAALGECHERHPEGEGLARSGRCRSADVATGESVGDRGGLDGEGMGHPASLKGLADDIGHAEIVEGDGDGWGHERVGHGISWLREGGFGGFGCPGRMARVGGIVWLTQTGGTTSRSANPPEGGPHRHGRA